MVCAPSKQFLESNFSSICTVFTPEFDSSSRRSPVSLCCVPILLWALPYFIAQHNVPVSTSTFSAPSWIGHLSRTLWIVLKGELYIETKIWTLPVFIAIGVLLLPCTLGKTRDSISRYTHIHISSICIYIYVLKTYTACEYFQFSLSPQDSS